MENISIQEAKKLQQELNDELLESIGKFEDQTGLSLKSVDLIKVEDGSTAMVNTEVEL